MDLEVSVDDEIRQLSMRRPHVVLLGAGASRAALPNGDRHGLQAPLMSDFIQVTGMARLLGKLGVEHEDGNLEDIFSALEREGRAEDMRALEEAVYEYFQQLALPGRPTIYDHLVLALRDKDLIASFNWDPFLVQAYRRNGRRVSLPKLAFLHGNVLIGYCAADRVTGFRYAKCSLCGRRFTPTPLLYPVKRKDYTKNEFIANEWRLLDWGLRNAFMLTIFGYRAPRTDREAVRAMRVAWGRIEHRNLEQVEIISIDDPDDLRRTWKPFLHTHHYDLFDDFYGCWVAQHPRRTGEAYYNQYLEAKFISDNPIPRDADFDELWQWFEPLRRAEEIQTGG